MESSDRLGLPYVMAAQAQKHITVNESFQRLDALVQMSVLSATIDAEPASPASGDAYILPATKSGTSWDEMAAGSVAVFQVNAWQEIVPVPGMRAFIQDTANLQSYDGSAWLGIGFVFTEGGDGTISFYRNDIDRVPNPRMDLISSLAGDVITLPTDNAAQYFFDDAKMAGVSYLRIWNTSKSPIESAWVKAVPDWSGDRKQLQVTDAADITSWGNGDTIQIGDPTSETPGRVIVLDISPMLQNVFGAVFPQKGLYCKGVLTGNTGKDDISLSPSGAGGTFNGISRVHTVGIPGTGNAIIPTNVLSPISNSNLVMLREQFTTTAGVSLVSAQGVLI